MTPPAGYLLFARFIKISSTSQLSNSVQLGFPSLAKALVVQNADARRDGYPNLQKAWAAMKVQGYPTLEKARAVLAALLGRRIVTKYMDAVDKLLWKNSMLNNATDPKKVDRECPICGEIVERDTPRWFDLRKSHPVSANFEAGSDYLTFSRV
jgi:hypothetical protein